MLKALTKTGQNQLIFCSHFFKLFLVVTQRYEVNVMDEYVLRGNTAIIKCHIPSFVADFVVVSSWQDSDGGAITPTKSDNYGTGFFYVNAMCFLPFGK